MTTTKNSMMNYLHWVIGVAIMLLGYVIPPVEPLTAIGIKALMVFIGMIYLWCTVSPVGGSLLALFMVSVIGYATYDKILCTAISNSTWVTVFFSSILMIAASESGMLKYVSHGIFKASQGVITGRPMVLIFIMMCLTFVLSALSGMIPTILMGWAICYSIIEELKLEKSDKYSMVMVMLCLMGAVLGNAAIPFQDATVIILAAFKSASNTAVPYGPFIFINLVCSLIIMVLFCAAIKYLFRIDLSKVKDIDGKVLAQEKLPPMSITVKTYFIAVISFIVCVLLAGMLPKEWAVTQFLNTLNTHGIAALFVVLLFIVKDHGKPCININHTMKSLPWGPLFMVMSAVYMAGVLKDKTTGIIPWLKAVLSPALAGHSEFVFAFLICFIALVLTCFIHNGALGNMLMPVLVVFSEASGFHSMSIAVVMTLVINIAFLAPSASNYAPLLHGNSEYISIQDIWTYGLCFEIIAFAVFLLLGLPMGRILM